MNDAIDEMAWAAILALLMPSFFVNLPHGLKRLTPGGETMTRILHVAIRDLPCIQAAGNPGSAERVQPRRFQPSPDGESTHRISRCVA